MTAAAARVPGLAHGWEGAAWATLQRSTIAGAPVPAGFFARLARRLDVVADHERDASPAQLIGIGGAATVALLGAERDARLAPVARRLVGRWAASTCAPACDDVILGHPGALLALGELRDACPRFQAPAPFVARCYRRTLAAIRRMLDADRPHLLGFAHGLAGLLLAAECGAARLGRRRDAALMARGRERLAVTRVIVRGLGTLWPATSGPALEDLASAWCHGTAGVALALAGCHRLTGDPDYEALLVEAAPTLRALPSPNRTFCCGRAGRAQILIELFRARGERRWLRAARAVAAEPTDASLSREQPAGFTQGALGLAYLDARLACPALPLPATGFGAAPPS